MALSSEEQELFDLAVAMMPHWFVSDSRSREFLGLAAKVMGSAREQSAYWFDMAQILLAVDATATDPDWLNQHAKDRGTSRQDGENDATLRQRLRNTPEALIRSSLLAAATAIVSAAGEPTSGIAMVELPRDQAFFQTNAQIAGTQGTFVALGGGAMKFTPNVAFARPPFASVVSPNGRTLKHTVTFSLSTVPGNDGTFVTTGLDGNGVLYTNGSGASSVDGTVSWASNRREINNQPYDLSRDDAYFSRGYRIGRRGGGTIIVILPFGCTEPTRLSVLEMLRQKGGAGLLKIVECRANP